MHASLARPTPTPEYAEADAPDAEEVEERVDDARDVRPDKARAGAQRPPVGPERRGPQEAERVQQVDGGGERERDHRDRELEVLVVLLVREPARTTHAHVLFSVRGRGLRTLSTRPTTHM